MSVQQQLSGTVTPGSLPLPEPGGTGLADYLAGSLPQRPQVSVSSPPTPQFSARAALPFAGSYGPAVLSGGPVASTRSVDDALAQIQGLTGETVPQVSGGQVNTALTTTRTVRGGRRGGGPAVRGAPPGGKVLVAGGADRAGVRTRGVVRRYVRSVSARIHGPVTITTGTNHNRLTVDGNVSDHWSGHAADIAVPIDSHRGDLIATAALEQAGVPRARARAMARHGGLFTINHNGLRIQVIWRTYQGGNHHNHVHVGVRPS